MFRSQAPPPPAANSGHSERELAEVREQLARLTEQQRVEAERHRTEGEQQRFEIGKMRDEQNRKEATQKTGTAQAALRSKVSAMAQLDKDMRAVIHKFDEEMMFAFADKDVDPSDITQPGVKEFFDKRKKLLDKASGQLAKMFSEAQQFVRSIRDDPRVPADLKSEFEAAANQEMSRAESVVKKPYPDPLASYEGAVFGVRTRRDVIRQQKIEKSKKAAAALTKRMKDLSIGDYNRFVLVIAFLRDVNGLHKNGKLTRESALNSSGILSLNPNSRSLVDATAAFLSVARDLRLNHDPEWPSYGESADEFARLLNADSIEGYLRKLIGE